MPAVELLLLAVVVLPVLGGCQRRVCPTALVFWLFATLLMTATAAAAAAQHAAPGSCGAKTGCPADVGDRLLLAQLEVKVAAAEAAGADGLSVHLELGLQLVNQLQGLQQPLEAQAVLFKASFQQSKKLLFLFI